MSHYLTRITEISVLRNPSCQCDSPKTLDCLANQKTLSWSRPVSHMESFGDTTLYNGIFGEIRQCASIANARNILHAITLLKIKRLYWHLWKTFSIHGIFSFHERFFIVQKGSLDYSNILHTKIFFFFSRTDHCKVLLGTKTQTF